MKLRSAAFVAMLTLVSSGAWGQSASGSGRAKDPLSGAYDTLKAQLEAARQAAAPAWEITSPARVSIFSGDDPQAVLGPRPYPELSGADLRNTSRALDDAKKMAKRGSRCDGALASFFVPSFADLLDRYVLEGPKAMIFDGRASTLIPPGWKRSVSQTFRASNNKAGAFVLAGGGMRVVTYLGPYFFAPTSMPWSAPQQRMIMLAHEAVHQFGNLGDDEFGGSLQLTRLIIDLCYPEGRGRLGGIEGLSH